MGYWRKHKDRLERKARGEPAKEEPAEKSATAASASGEVTPSAPDTPAGPPVAEKKEREFEEEEEEDDDDDAGHTHSVCARLTKHLDCLLALCLHKAVALT